MIVRSNTADMTRTTFYTSVCICLLLLSSRYLQPVTADNDACNHPFANRSLSLLNGSAISYRSTPSSVDFIASCPAISDSSCCSAQTDDEFHRITEAFHSSLLDFLRAVPTAVISRVLAHANVNISFATLTPAQSSLLHTIQQTIGEVVLMPATATCVDMLTAQVAGTLCWSCSPQWQQDIDAGAVKVNSELVYVGYRSCQTSLDALSARVPAITEHFVRLIATANMTDASSSFLQNAYVMHALMAQAEGFTYGSLVGSSLVSWMLGIGEGQGPEWLFATYALRGLDYDFESWMRPYSQSEWAPFRVSGSMGHQTGDLWHRLPASASAHSHRRLLSVEPANLITPVAHDMSIMHGAMAHEEEMPTPTAEAPPLPSLLSLVRTATQQTLLDSSSDAHTNGRVAFKPERDIKLNPLELGCASTLTHTACPEEKLEILLPRATFVPVLIAALSLLTIIALVLTVRHNLMPNAKTFRRMKRDGDKFITADNTAPAADNIEA